MVKVNNSSLAGILRNNRLKATPQRIAILHVLERHTQPLTIEKIKNALPSSAGVDSVTVYRTMDVLYAKGVVRKVDFHHSHTHFELRRERDHHHIVCTRCGRVEDVQGCTIQELSSVVLKKTPTFSTIDDHTLEFFGMCSRCARKKR